MLWSAQQRVFRLYMGKKRGWIWLCAAGSILSGAHMGRGDKGPWTRETAYASCLRQRDSGPRLHPRERPQFQAVGGDHSDEHKSHHSSNDYALR